jgi:hypothetical protein
MPVGRENENENEYDEAPKTIVFGSPVATSVSEWTAEPPLAHARGHPAGPA